MKPIRQKLIATTLVVLWAGIHLAIAETSAAGTGHVIVHAGKVLDVKSGKTLVDQAIVIDAGKIVSIGPASAAPAMAGATIVNLPNATVLPGLIDAHTHLTYAPSFGYESLAISVPRE